MRPTASAVKKSWNDFLHYIDGRNDETFCSDSRHIVIVYSDDSESVKAELQDQANRHGWTLIYREVTR